MIIEKYILTLSSVSARKYLFLVLLVLAIPACSQAPTVYEPVQSQAQTRHNPSPALLLAGDSSRTAALSSVLGMHIRWVFQSPDAISKGKYMLKVFAADSVLSLKRQQLSLKMGELATVFIFYADKPSALPADSVYVGFYQTGDSLHPKIIMGYCIATLLKKRPTLKSRIIALFDLCPYHDHLRISDSLVHAYFSSSYQFTDIDQQRFGAFSISFSIMITKYIDSKRRTIKGVFINWHDITGRPVELHYSPLEPTFLQWEEMF